MAGIVTSGRASYSTSFRSPATDEFARQKWVDDAYNTQDRSNYVNPDGSIMNDVEYRQALEAIFETKATDGANKIEPGYIYGSRRN